MVDMKRKQTANPFAKKDDRIGIKSIETGMRLLIALTEDTRPQSLKEISRRAQMHPAKAHRYLVSYAKSGVVDQDQITGHYHFGQLALKIGVTALGGLNVVRISAPELARLRDETEITAALGIWGPGGAAHILIEETPRRAIVKSRLGAALPTCTSATGALFVAFLPRDLTQHLVDQELASAAKSAAELTQKHEEFEALLSTIRKRRMSRVMGDFAPGVHALGAPIFDHTGAIVATITILAAAGEFDPSFNGPFAKRLSEAAKSVSLKMGWTDDTMHEHISPRRT